MKNISEETLELFETFTKKNLVCKEFFSNSLFTSKDSLVYYNKILNELKPIPDKKNKLDVFFEYNDVYKKYIFNDLKEDIVASAYNILLLDEEIEEKPIKAYKKYGNLQSEIEEYFDQLIKDNNLNYENFIDTYPDMKNQIEIDNHPYVKSLKKSILDIDFLMNNFIEKFKSFSKSNELKLTSLNHIYNKNSDSEIISFINKKKHENLIREEISLTKSQDYLKMIIFNDKSILLEKQNGEIVIPKNNEEYKKYTIDFFNSYIEYIFRKKPKYKSLFQDSFQKEGLNFNGVMMTAHNLLKHEALIKSHNIDIMEELKNNNLEYIDDLIERESYKNKINKFAFSIVSNKYKYLYDEKSFELFKKIYEMDLSSNYLQDNIGRKIASFKDSNDLNEKLSILINTLDEFYLNSILIKSEKCNIEKTYCNDDVLILKIKDFESSKKLGSASWCISRNSSYFNSYTDNQKEQYFIYDFKKESIDNYSMIGITIDNEGKIVNAHAKNDDCIMHKDFIYKYQEILKNEKLKIKNKKMSYK